MWDIEELCGQLSRHAIGFEILREDNLGTELAHSLDDQSCEFGHERICIRYIELVSIGWRRLKYVNAATGGGQFRPTCDFEAFVHFNRMLALGRVSYHRHLMAALR